MSKINILIADDHKLIRETWSYILNSDARFQVIAECGDAQEAVELAKTKRPHVVLMDINMTPFPVWRLPSASGRSLPARRSSVSPCTPSPPMRKKCCRWGPVATSPRTLPRKR
ncbi:response regulator [Puia sp. P3]|uniref:response regulator n=1 Tax=Puia sp. P3 TaxID=3423952 RepID=UPI003D67D236